MNLFCRRRWGMLILLVVMVMLAGMVGHGLDYLSWVIAHYIYL